MNTTARNIIFWILIAFLVIFGAYLYRKINEKGDSLEGRRGLIISMTQDAVIVAIIVLLGFVPSIGYIPVVPGVISLTLIHLPVLLGAALFGPKRGIIYGLAFGLTSWAQATMNPTGLNFFFIYPWVSILPRVIFGFLAGLIFDLLDKKTRICRRSFGQGVIFFLLTLLHTGLVFASLFIFFGRELVELANGFAGGVVLGLTLGFSAIIVIGALGEALLSAIALPPLVKALSRKKRKHS